MKLTLTVKGHMPSFKNSKMIARGRLITSPRKQKIMDAVIRDFESQLRLWSQTILGGTLTASSQRSLIASSVPADDCWQWIPEINVRVSKVGKGLENVIIHIEPI